eukprot:7091862-Alexandrium_andersonii.AAC.1
MELHGALLRIHRMYHHLAALARVHKPPPGQAWHYEMERVLEALKRRATRCGLTEFSPDLNAGVSGWHRVALA